MLQFVGRVATMAFFAAVCGHATGCILVTRRPPATPVAARAPRCHPSQHWDGTQCRHNGKGHGARKHDGPPR